MPRHNYPRRAGRPPRPGPRVLHDLQDEMHRRQRYGTAATYTTRSTR